MATAVKKELQWGYAVSILDEVVTYQQKAPRTNSGEVHQNILHLYLTHTDTGNSCWEWGIPNPKNISSRTSEKWSWEAATEPWFSLGKFYRSTRTQKTSTGKLRFNLRWWGSSDHIWGDTGGKPDQPTLCSLKVSPANTAALSEQRLLRQEK